jgi:membrane-associated phospholipid phosphatase
VLGIFVATAFSSAGPCFARLITGTHRYDELLGRLQAAHAIAPLLAIRGQAYLWQAYATGAIPVGGGISALPSLHVAGATLCALAFSERHRLLGWLGWLYVGLIWLASVMLAWHYALDGEVALVAVVPCWAAAGLLTPAPSRRPAVNWRWAQTGAASPESGTPVGGPPPLAQRPRWTLWP